MTSPRGFDFADHRRRRGVWDGGAGEADEGDDGLA
jgi:hypothetical protein